jgi:hypothetical protein
MFLPSCRREVYANRTATRMEKTLDFFNTPGGIGGAIPISTSRLLTMACVDQSRPLPLGGFVEECGHLLNNYVPFGGRIERQPTERKARPARCYSEGSLSLGILSGRVPSRHGVTGLP